MTDTVWRLSGSIGDVEPESPELIPQVMTQGIGFPLREVDGVPPEGTADLYNPDTVAAGNFMSFMGDWTVGLYYFPGSVVFEAGWTMVANKVTTDYPSPQTVGSPRWISGFGESPAWTIDNAVSSEVQSGQRYTPSSDGYVTSLRIWVESNNTDVTYEVWLVDDPLGDPQIRVIAPEQNYTNTGWNTIQANATLVLEGSTFSLLKIARDRAGSATFTGDWAYLTPNVGDPNPAAGTIVHRRNVGALPAYAIQARRSRHRAGNRIELLYCRWKPQ